MGATVLLALHDDKSITAQTTTFGDLSEVGRLYQ